MSYARSHIQAPLNNPTKRSWGDKAGELGGHLDLEFLEIIQLPKMYLNL